MSAAGTPRQGRDVRSPMYAPRTAGRYGFVVPEKSTSSRKVKHRKLADEVAATLRDMIFEGELAPDERRTQDELAALLGVSTMPVREGLLKLAAAGLVEASPNRSFRVIRTTREDIADIFWLHSVLAAELTRRACEKRDENLVLRLQTLQEELQGAAESGDVSRVEELNWQFHRAINIAAEAPKLLFSLRATLRFIPEGAYRYLDGWMQMSTAGHSRIVEAFVSGDCQEAARGAADHVQEAGGLLLMSYGDGHWLPGQSTSSPL